MNPKATKDPRRDPVVDAQMGRKRTFKAIAGLAMMAMGVSVLLKEPEHGQWVALFLVGFGGTWVDDKHVLSTLKTVLHRGDDS